MSSTDERGEGQPWGKGRDGGKSGSFYVLMLIADHIQPPLAAGAERGEPNVITVSSNSRAGLETCIESQQASFKW